ncbi:zinc finger matrin-type protein 1-like isoform X2 [Numida meleagris]|uniref:zinc finger matrin-type protein 1-like isoform X2 n=1 Tax=Numida meleagris TaxID=8996 RepID=UPI000B3E4009|nr:zinc finger matrin-type protein 1-like isoform X2 [Numida meleagris]
MKPRWVGPWEESVEMYWHSGLNYRRPWPVRRLRGRRPRGRGYSDDILDEATRHYLFTDAFCRVCWAVLPFESQRMSHYEGRKHARNVYLYVQRHSREDERMRHDKKKEIMDCTNFQMDGTRIVEEKYCNLCNIILISPVVASSHLQGKIHAKKLRQLAEKRALVEAQSMQPVPVPSETETPSSSSKASLDLSYCRLCCVPFNNPLSAQEHYVGKKHGRNVARKKVMEELGVKPVPRESTTNDSFFSAIGFGRYACPVCNVVLTTIHEYQSHVQGKKHRISLCRARKIHSLTKSSKKTYYSFQGQKATGLEERMDLEIAEEFQDRNLGEVIPSAFKCEQNQHSSLFSETQTPTNTGKKRSPSCSSACGCALENTLNCQHNTAHCTEGQASGVAAIRDESFGLSAVESKEYCKLVLAETFSISYGEEQNLQIKYTEEKKYISEELKCKKEGSELKRKEDSEGADLEKEREKRKRIKLDIGLLNEKKSRPYKDERRKKKPAKKGSRKRTKNKKMPQIKVKAENELL